MSSDEGSVMIYVDRRGIGELCGRYMCIYDDIDDVSQNISGGAEILSTSESCGFFPLGALFLFFQLLLRMVRL